MAEVYNWLFVDFIPLLYEERRVAKQLKVETWLDLTQLLNEIKNEAAKAEKKTVKQKMNYVT